MEDINSWLAQTISYETGIAGPSWLAHFPEIQRDTVVDIMRNDNKMKVPVEVISTLDTQHHCFASFLTLTFLTSDPHVMTKEPIQITLVEAILLEIATPSPDQLTTS